jgi:DNA-binding CsgD family transcriptional regulator
MTIPFELERSFPDERLVELALGPLSLGAVHRLLEERLGLELTRPELARVQEATAGNPFFALELGRELVRTGTRPSPGQALRVPESLRELLGGRLARLPAEVVDVLLQVAALARPTVELVASTYGDRERVLEALEAAVREGVVELDESRVRFPHPLVASICYEQAPVWKRRAVHRALAGAVSDVEERARHLALAVDGPDASVASELEAAAGQAAGRGATAAAAELSELAVELTPDDPASQRRRRFLAAKLHHLAGDTERAITMFEDLLDDVPHGYERADVLFELAVTQSGGARVQLERCNEALIEAEGDDIRSARILSMRSGCHLLGADARAALVDVRAALEKAERTGDPALLAQTIAWVGLAETFHGETTPGLLERGIEIEETLGLELEWNHSPRYALARRMMRLGEADGARAIFEIVEAQAVARGDEITRMMVLWGLSIVEWLAGNWPLALEHCAAAYDLTEQTQHPHAQQYVGRAKAVFEADVGLVEAARASAEEGLAYSRTSAYDFAVIITLGVLGRLELALGNLEAAAAHLRDLPRQLTAGGINDPSAPVWADAIETLIALGELEQARAYLDEFEQNARHFGSQYTMAAGVMRCRGLLLAAEGDLEDAFETFEGGLIEQSERWPFERARTLLCLGTVRRQAQQKKAAREALEQALAVFEELGARLWAEKARAELKRISGRAPASDELTESERRVAELAARGRTNREIAAELFMGMSTVEAHLSHVYRKLGVRRAELATRLSVPVEAAPKA